MKEGPVKQSCPLLVGRRSLSLHQVVKKEKWAKWRGQWEGDKSGTPLYMGQWKEWGSFA